MSSEMYKCKITIIKRTINQDLINEFLDEKYRNAGPCEVFQDNQEFILEGETAFSQPPSDFCAWAWADIRKDILTMAVGGTTPGFRERNVAIAGCTDWFRPVIFKIERIE